MRTSPCSHTSGLSSGAMFDHMSDLTYTQGRRRRLPAQPEAMFALYVAEYYAPCFVALPEHAGFATVLGSRIINMRPYYEPTRSSITLPPTTSRR